MNVLTYSYFPLRADHWAGGAQTFLGELIQALTRLGFDFRVLCPKVSDGERLLDVPNIRHLPVLDEPMDQYLKFDVRAKNLTHFREHLSWADVVWTVDEPFPLRVTKPVVSSLQTLDGFEENQSVFCFNWDALVAASGFLANCVKAVAGEEMWEKGSAPRVYTVHNGIDLDRFTRTDPRPLMDRLSLPPDRQYLVFPHRPESAKGFDRALAVIRELKCRGSNYTLLVPTAPRSVGAVVARQAEFYRTLRERIAAEGLADHVILHDWISPHNMPAYLSLGQWCLVTSLLPEGFCFVPVQAVACGTPVVSSRSGAIRERFDPGHGVFYSDSQSIEAVVDTILSESPVADLRRGRRYVEDEYGIALCASRYADILRTTVPSQARLRPLSLDRVKATPWWYEMDALPGGSNRVWHDTRMRPIDLPPHAITALRALRDNGPKPIDTIPPGALDTLIENTLAIRC